MEASINPYSLKLAEELRPGEEVFLGPGTHLMFPLGYVKHPECAHVLYPVELSSPPCLCVYPTLRIPLGYKYRVTDHVEITGPALLRKDGYTFFMAPPK